MVTSSMGKKTIAAHFGSAEVQITEAVQRADKMALSDQYNYRKSYLALRWLIRDHLDLTDTNALLAACHAVYGWMPTILKTIGQSTDAHLHLLSSFIRDARQVSSTTQAAEALRTLTKDNFAILQSVNHSVIGTSKLLHFAIPHCFQFGILESQEVSGFLARVTTVLRPIWNTHARCIDGYKEMKAYLRGF